MTGRTDFNGHTTAYTYNNMNRLTQKTADAFFSQGACAGGACGATQVSYTYTPTGKRLTMTDAIGQWKYGYDGMDRLTDKTNLTVAGLAAHWDYDRAGNLADMQTSHSSQTNYTIACPELWRRNALNRLSGVNNLGEQVPASYSAVYPERSRRDAVGNLSGMTIGKLSTSYGGACPEESRRNFENRLALRDDARRGGVSIVGACPRGEPAQRASRRNGDGNRISETVAGNTTRYLVAEVNPTGYPQVVEEQSGTGSMAKFYMWGQQLLLSTVFSGNFPSQIYGYDGHGSVRFLTDLNGKITDTYDVACPEVSRRNAFGNLINQTGTTVNNYLFAGEQFDPALGIYYNRARYYDERSGRFWSMDTYDGESDDPSSLHKYLYGQNNPVSQIDPTGHNGITDVALAIGIQGTLNAIAFGSVGFAFAKARGLTTSEAFKVAAKAGGVGFLLAVPYLGFGVGLYYTSGFIYAAYTGQLSSLDYWEFSTYVVVALALRQVSPGIVKGLIRSAKGASGPPLLPAGPTTPTSPSPGPAQVFLLTEGGVAIPDGVEGTASAGGDFSGLAGADPVDVLRRVPSNWTIDDTKGEGGVIFRNPANPNFEWMRIMPDDPNSPYPNSQGPYMRWFRNGSYVDAAGNSVSSTDASGHIPLKGNAMAP